MASRSEKQRLLYFWLNKPRLRDTVSDPEGGHRDGLLPKNVERVYPVGRLDYGSGRTAVVAK